MDIGQVNASWEKLFRFGLSIVNFEHNQYKFSATFSYDFEHVFGCWISAEAARYKYYEKYTPLTQAVN